MYQGVIINPQPTAPPTPPARDKSKEKRWAWMREIVTAASLLLALWLSGLMAPVGAFVDAHRSQVTLAVALYLLLRYFGWVLVGLLGLLLGLLVASPVLAWQWLRERLRRRLAAKA